jgi:SAM-dependent methyltransferase
MHRNALLVFREHAAPRVPREGRILELGPDGDPSTFARECGSPAGWETADLTTETGAWSHDHSTASILMPSEYVIPVSDDTYDVVISGNVAEHVRELWTWMVELARVTKPGGQIVTISPVSWTYHEAPVDCWRIYPAGMEALSRFAGLAVEFSWWGTLEQPDSKRTYPGRGLDWDRPNAHGLKYRAKQLIGWPMPIAYDQVTIARKPSRPA